jgi:hypothetical protein
MATAVRAGGPKGPRRGQEGGLPMLDSTPKFKFKLKELEVSAAGHFKYIVATLLLVAALVLAYVVLLPR